jgi:hypothetical protein
MKRIAFLLLLLARTAGASTPCECPATYDIAKERDRHDLVLYGTVFAARDSTLPRSGSGPAPYIHLVSIKVMGVWKGNPSRELVLQLDPCAARHADPQPGESWIVYADSVSGKPVIPACTASAKRTGSNAEYTVLGMPKSLNVPARKKPTPH